MANERKWDSVTRIFAADGTINGVITVTSASGFKVKARVILQSDTQPQTAFEIKNIPSKIRIEIGPIGKDIDHRSDISLFKLIDNAKITQPKQKRPAIGPAEIDRAVYIEEPTVARRVFPVDEYGDAFTVQNPFPVQLSDGSVNIGTVNAELEVQLTAKDNDPKPGDIHDSVRIGDGTNELAVNPDGSINVDAAIHTAGATNPFILNIPILLASTEYSATLPQDTKEFLLRMRDSSKFKLAYVSGDTAINYITINCGVVYSKGDLSLVAPLTMYFNSSRPSEVVEIIYWT